MQAIVPDRLKAKRREQRYSQRALARAAGVPYSSISNIEAGRVKYPKYPIIIAIAGVLDAEPNYFFEPLAVKSEHAGILHA